MRPLWDYRDYRKYLDDYFEHSKVRGAKSRFAEAMSCRSGYVSQILAGLADLSLEQADAATEFFGHTEEESQFFLLLVSQARAGTQSLRTKIQKQIQSLSEKQLNLKNRFKVSPRISEVDEVIFYSSWKYLAILTLLTIPNYDTKEAISERLHLPLKQVAEALEEMEQAGLVKRKKGRYMPGTVRTHLGADSPMVSKHHLNWRLQSMASIEKRLATDLHYSSVVSLSEADAQTIKQVLINALERTNEIIAPSKEERLMAICIDLFEL